MLGRVDLGDRIRDFEIKQLGGLFQPFRMRSRAEDRAAVGSLALEHAARIMQPVGQHVQRRAGPGHQLAVIPDEAVASIERLFHDVFLREANSFPPVRPGYARVDPAA